MSIYSEINKISDQLKNIGYFTNTFNITFKDNKNIVATYILGTKIDKVIIRNKNQKLSNLLDLRKDNDSISIKIEQLQPYLHTISKKLEEKGASFSKVQLTNIEVNKKNLIADIRINESKKRKIDSVIIKGYEHFSNGHLKHYFNIKDITIFNKEKIKEVSSLSKALHFIQEIKEPEVLFTKDSTLLYLYFNKKQNNNFDGLINFASKENGDVFFNGHLDLELNNIVNTGEQFKLLWNRLNENKQEFQASTILPYIFNSPITPSISFNIFKQDTTFLNTELKTNINYSINSKIKLAATYTNINSNNLQQQLTENNIEEFKNAFLGIRFNYLKPTNNFFRNNKFFLEINPAFGNRTSKKITSKQFLLKLKASYLWEINQRNRMSFFNNTGYLKSDNYLNNELFRIGGANSIRGFDEQSIYTSIFSYFNIEYQYLTSSTSYFYTITDYGSIKENKKKKNLVGLGVGYLFQTNNSQINLSTAIGQTNTTKLHLKNARISISLKNYF